MSEEFQRAQAKYELDGEPLRPYSQSRKDAAELMGLQYPYLSPEDAERIRKTNRYPAMKRDTAIVLWLCSIKDTMDLAEQERGAWTPERAFNNPSGAVAEAMEWINSKEWSDPKHEGYIMAHATAMAIILDAELSDFFVKVEGNPKPEKKRTNTPSTDGRKQRPESTV